jgi:hypothetical protein
MAEIEKIRTSIGASEDVEQRLLSIAEQYGVQPRS